MIWWLVGGGLYLAGSVIFGVLTWRDLGDRAGMAAALSLLWLPVLVGVMVVLLKDDILHRKDIRSWVKEEEQKAREFNAAGGRNPALFEKYWKLKRELESS